MHRDLKYFNANTHTKICSAHFKSEHFLDPDAKKRRLKREAIPSFFAWSKEEPETEPRTVVKKLDAIRLEKDEVTDTASEGEGDELINVASLTMTLRKTQTKESDFCNEFLDVYYRIPCWHRFSVYYLLSKCTSPAKEEKLFTHFTGFNCFGNFVNTLKFLLPDLDRKI